MYIHNIYYMSAAPQDVTSRCCRHARNTLHVCSYTNMPTPDTTAALYNEGTSPLYMPAYDLYMHILIDWMSTHPTHPHSSVYCAHNAPCRHIAPHDRTMHARARIQSLAGVSSACQTGIEPFSPQCPPLSRTRDFRAVLSNDCACEIMPCMPTHLHGN